MQIIFGNRWRHLLGEKDFWEHVGGIDISLAPSSFGQAFDSLLRKLHKYVPCGSSVADLYAGAGSIRLSLAVARKCRQEPLSWLEGSDVVVVDPPRKGLDYTLVEALQTLASSERKVKASKSTFIKGKDEKNEKRPWILCARESSVQIESKTPWEKNQSFPRTLIYISCGWESFNETGSGKTYTMWGPPSAMLEDHSPSSNHGIVPRIFQMLFSEFQREQEQEQEKSEETHINYQCRYSVLEGLSNRKVGASSINSKSSRSRIIFTCVIESWCKETSSQAYDSTTNGGVVHLGTDDVSRMTNELTESKFIFNPSDTLRNFRETSTQEDYHVSNGGLMHFGVDDVSRTINRQSGTAFHTYLRSTLAISREMGTQEEYCVSNGGDIHLGINVVSTTINRQTGSEFHVNPHSTLAIPRKTSTKVNCHVFKWKFHAPRDTSTQTDDSISNRGVAQLDTNDAYRAANVKTRIESDSQTFAIPQLAREIFNVPIKGEYAQSNGGADNELPMMLTSISLAGLFGIYAIVCCISWVFVYLKVP
ncbi:hypothetical protein GIB67_010633 [Kingdonia uniflora]|uniref:Kinesin motor domain-containing protein n=1 Tax=Kingdonia uniflora TaxID=39325 RepID=A0A7J7NR61_9MAGN|nr:hypothetical protein GIB67_010633 [Kingdonia uniflora]